MLTGRPTSIEKTEAIVLRVSPFSGTSHMVTWLTRDFGRITTSIKGACRPRSAFLGQYDQFYSCQLLFYARARNGVHIAKECSPINMRPQFRSRWSNMAAASYLCDLILRITVDGAGDPELYGLLSDALDSLCETEAVAPFVFWFELHLLEELGMAPHLDRCLGCGHTPNLGTEYSLSASQERIQLVFSHHRGGLLCSRCHGDSSMQTSPLTPDLLAILRRWQVAKQFNQIRHIRCTDNQLLDFRRILGMFLEYHLHIAPLSRGIALELAEMNHPA